MEIRLIHQLLTTRRPEAARRSQKKKKPEAAVVGVVKEVGDGGNYAITFPRNIVVVVAFADFHVFLLLGEEEKLRREIDS